MTTNIDAAGPLDRGVRPSRFNPAKELGYPDFNEDGHALAAGPFKCPECGGWTFGSSIGKKGKAEKGYCNDAHGIGCRFQWDRADDRKYFAATTAEDGPNSTSGRRSGHSTVLHRLASGHDPVQGHRHSLIIPDMQIRLGLWKLTYRLYFLSSIRMAFFILAVTALAIGGMLWKWGWGYVPESAFPPVYAATAAVTVMAVLWVCRFQFYRTPGSGMWVCLVRDGRTRVSVHLPFSIFSKLEGNNPHQVVQGFLEVVAQQTKVMCATGITEIRLESPWLVSVVEGAAVPNSEFLKRLRREVTRKIRPAAIENSPGGWLNWWNSWEGRYVIKPWRIWFPRRDFPRLPTAGIIIKL